MDRRWLLAVLILSSIVTFVVVALCEANVIFRGPLLGAVCRPLMHRIVFPVSQGLVSADI